MAILRRTDREMVRAMCGAKLMEKKGTEDLMDGNCNKVQHSPEQQFLILFYARTEGNCGSDGKGEWSEMVRTFKEKRWSLK